MMAPGSTAQIDRELVRDQFASYFEDDNLCLFSTDSRGPIARCSRNVDTERTKSNPDDH